MPHSMRCARTDQTARFLLQPPIQALILCLYMAARYRQPSVDRTDPLLPPRGSPLLSGPRGREPRSGWRLIGDQGGEVADLRGAHGSGQPGCGPGRTSVRPVAQTWAPAGRHLHSARRPDQQIEVPIDGWNERWRPFTWAKTADDLLPQCQTRLHATLSREHLLAHQDVQPVDMRRMSQDPVHPLEVSEDVASAAVDVRLPSRQVREHLKDAEGGR